jgi:hypothetical protein
VLREFQSGREGLDAQAEIYVFFVAGVGVDVVGGAAVELVALAHLATDEEAKSYRAETGGDPANGLDEGRFVVVLKLFLSGERQGCGNRDNLGICVEDAEIGTELHVKDDSAGEDEMGGRVDEVNASFVLNDWVGGNETVDAKTQVQERYFWLRTLAV